ncbi:glycosyltransferase family 2 protein [Marinilactibacillus sp. GCM10026970]|uniref:glycosyltransferase family 2 protein n=1 Tax=Marinilactibacillus sp. GCM10026970 TaxID=3252642 RepID=UPI003621501C
MSKKPLLTIFTPTFNRAQELKRVYASLIVQTSNNFVWNILDDGSEDETEMMVEAWREQNIISISYEKQQNQGKTKSMNKGIKASKTALWMCLDSDDWLHEEAVKVIERYDKKMVDQPNACGMIGLRRLPSGQQMQNKQIPESYDMINYHHLRYELGIEPEYLEVYKTDIIKNFLYPEISGEIYFPLSYMHDRLSKEYDFLVVREPLMFIEYQNEGMTKKRNQLIINNPIGYMLFKKQLLELAPTNKVALVSAIAYNSAAILAKRRDPVNTIKGKMLAGIVYPISLIDYVLRFKLKQNLHLEKTYK